jgi:2-polyprenyl-3-methyl-5-hydroxy-6-metoxy-1,4-benzoquinol methylase
LGSIGTSVRALFGAHEQAVAALYRGLFLNLDAVVNRLATTVQPRRILEVGCGEGQMTSLMARAFPSAQLLAIDISPRAGRLFNGSEAHVQFRCCSVPELLTEHPAPFDLITLCDVLHHVPSVHRVSLLGSIRALLSNDGTLFVKEWERRATPIHWACALSDRFITGDVVEYYTLGELQKLLEAVFVEHEITEQLTAPPWINNRIITVRNRGKQASCAAAVR